MKRVHYVVVVNTLVLYFLCIPKRFNTGNQGNVLFISIPREMPPPSVRTSSPSLWMKVLAIMSLVLAMANAKPAVSQQQLQQENLTLQRDETNVLRLNELHRHAKTHRTFKRIYDQYNYIEETQSTLVKAYGSKTLKNMRFLHIPKTGTTFAATFAHYCCDGLHGKYFDALRQFTTILPGFVMKKVCDVECFSAQPRSPNGDPWAHIPYRDKVDSNHNTVAMLRHPIDRLASQLAYTQVIGPKLSITFGLRRVDGHILFHLLSFNYDHNLQRYLDILKDNSEGRVKATELGQYAYRHTIADNLPTLQPTDYSQHTQFLQRAQECITMQSNMHINVNAARDIYNLSHSATSTYERLYTHFHGDVHKLRSFMQCGLDAAVLYPGLQGCQTRMILGRNCYDSYTLIAEDVTEAKRRLTEQFLFVGITEQWNTSIDLFHRHYGGNLYSDELLIQRSAKAHTAKTRTLLKQTLLQVLGADVYDTPLYEHALRLFQFRLAAADAE